MPEFEPIQCEPRSRATQVHPAEPGAAAFLGGGLAFVGGGAGFFAADFSAAGAAALEVAAD